MNQSIYTEIPEMKCMQARLFKESHEPVITGHRVIEYEGHDEESKAHISVRYRDEVVRAGSGDILYVYLTFKKGATTLYYEIVGIALPFFEAGHPYSKVVLDVPVQYWQRKPFEGIFNLAVKRIVILQKGDRQVMCLISSEQVKTIDLIPEEA